METELSAKRQEIRVELEAGGRTIAAGTGDEMDWIRGVARVAAEAAESVAGIHASAYALPSGAQATAQAVYDPKGIALTIGIPAGADGQEGTPGQDGLDAPQIDDAQASAEQPWSGQKVQEELDALTAEDVGALAATGSGALVQTGRVELSVPADGWTQNAQGWYEKTVACAGTVADSQTQRVDAAVQGAQIGNVLLAGLRVDADDTLTLVCLAQPSQAFTLVALISEVV